MGTKPRRSSAHGRFLSVGFATAISVMLGVCAPLALAAPGDIVTIAGNGAAGYSGDGADAQTAALNGPLHIALGPAEADLYVVDNGNHAVRRIDLSTGVITTVAGNGSLGYAGDGGPASLAQLANPWSVAVDAAGNVYISDQGNRRIRKVDAATAIISTIAGDGIAGGTGDGGPATSARFRQVTGLALDGVGGLYAADWETVRVRRIDLATGIIDNFAGSGAIGSGGDGGPAVAAQLDHLTSVVVNSVGDVYLVDDTQHIRRVDHATGVIDTVVGNGGAGFGGDGGPATSALISFPFALALDGSDNLFFADTSNNRIRRVDRVTQTITTVAGNGSAAYGGDGGAATAASLSSPRGLAVDSQGDLFIADSVNQRIRRVTACTDNDADSVCETYDPCTNVGHTQDFDAHAVATLTLGRINVDPSAGNESLRLHARFSLPSGVGFADLDPLLDGARLVLRSAAGQPLLDVWFAPGAYDKQARRGWSGNASTWKFVDASGQLASGSTTMKLRDRGGGAAGGSVAVVLSARSGTFSIAAADQPVNAVIVLGGQAAAAAGLCAESRFASNNCSFNGSMTNLKCRR